MVSKIIEQLQNDYKQIEPDDAFSKEFLKGYESCILDLIIIEKQFNKAIDKVIKENTDG